MGKYIRKPKGDAENAVIDVAQVVGVRNRALMENAYSAAESSAPPKIRKLKDGDFELKNLRRLPENCSTIQCSNSNNSDQSSTSCCSSNADLEEEESLEIGTTTYSYSGRRSSREITPSIEAEIGEMESTAKPDTAADFGRQTTAVKMPSAEEVEEFFALAEKNIHKKFEDKYNYDFVNDKPLEGRYEWVRLKE